MSAYNKIMKFVEKDLFLYLIFLSIQKKRCTSFLIELNARMSKLCMC